MGLAQDSIITDNVELEPVSPPHPLQTLGKLALSYPQCWGPAPCKSQQVRGLSGRADTRTQAQATGPTTTFRTAYSSSPQGYASPRMSRSAQGSWYHTGDPEQLQSPICNIRTSCLRSFQLPRGQLPPGTPSPTVSSHPQETKL